MVDLAGHGGIVDAGRYQFGINQGLTLRDGLVDTGNYSIEVAMQFDPPLSSFVKLLDFKELSADDGLYVFGQGLIL